MWAVFFFSTATVQEAADLQAAVVREKQGEELMALHMAARRAALDHAAEAQERADLAELKAYQDNMATQLQRKALSGDVAKREVRPVCLPIAESVCPIIRARSTLACSLACLLACYDTGSLRWSTR
jgi:hypothetical protein